MSNFDEKVEEMRTLIESLEIEPLEIKSLTRYHNSVNISFTYLLEHVDKRQKKLDKSIEKAESPKGSKLSQDSSSLKDIKTLVDTYKDMAQKYYLQFEHSLLKEIEMQRNFQRDVDDLKLSVGTSDVNLKVKEGKRVFETSIDLFEKSSESAGYKYRDLIEKYPKLMQDALNKLRDEWQRIDTIVGANQIFSQVDEKRALQIVMSVAAQFLDIKAKRIIIVPGNEFALYSFTYLENFGVLTIPIYSMQAVWEWRLPN